MREMNLRILFVSGCLLIAAFSTALRAACPLLSLEEQFAGNASVFVGRVTSQRVIPASGTSSHSMMTETTLDVEDVWKGDLGSVAQVRTCSYRFGNETVTCSEDVYFSIGTTYIVFARGTPLQTNGCSSTARVDSAEGRQIMLALAEKPHHKPR